MTRPGEPEDGDQGPFEATATGPADGHATTSPCPRCRALEERIAALEAEAAALRSARTRPRSGRSPDRPGADRRVSAVARAAAPGFQGAAADPARLGRGLGAAPVAVAAELDGRGRARLPLPAAGHRQPVGLAGPLPDRRPRHLERQPGLEGLRVEVEPQYEQAIKSQFGSGIVTFSPPWLFRTPPGWDLYLKGPSNRWKPNCHPLEGIIETWWLNYTFTINWKLVEPGTVVSPGARASASSCPSRTPRSRGPRRSRPRSACSSPRPPASCSNGSSGAGSSSAGGSPSITSTARPRASTTTSARSACRRSSRTCREKRLGSRLVGWALPTGQGPRPVGTAHPTTLESVRRNRLISNASAPATRPRPGWSAGSAGCRP